MMTVSAVEGLREDGDKIFDIPDLSDFSLINRMSVVGAASIEVQFNYGHGNEFILMFSTLMTSNSFYKLQLN